MITVVSAVLAVLFAAGLAVSTGRHRRWAEREADRRWYTEEQTWWAQLHTGGSSLPASGDAAPYDRVALYRLDRVGLG